LFRRQGCKKRYSRKNLATSPRGVRQADGAIGYFRSNDPFQKIVTVKAGVDFLSKEEPSSAFCFNKPGMYCLFCQIAKPGLITDDDRATPLHRHENPVKVACFAFWKELGDPFPPKHRRGVSK